MIEPGRVCIVHHYESIFKTKDSRPILQSPCWLLRINIHYRVTIIVYTWRLVGYHQPPEVQNRPHPLTTDRTAEIDVHG